MGMEKMIIIITLATAVCACNSPMTYEEKIDAYNATVQASYDDCVKDLTSLNSTEPNIRGIGDGLCTYSRTLRGENNKECTAFFWRKTTMFSGSQSCEPYYDAANSHGTLVVAQYLADKGRKTEIKTAIAKDLTDEDRWRGDLFCGNTKKSENFSNAVFDPYLFSEPNIRKRLPGWENFGWNMTLEDGTQINLKNLKDFRDYKNCQIFWRYPNIIQRYQEIQKKLGY